MNEPRILAFPTEGYVSVGAASRWTIWTGRLRILLGQIANRIGIPGMIQPIVMDDPVTGQHIEIRLGVLFSCISVDGRDYYFRRFTGKYDGAGMGCACGLKK